MKELERSLFAIKMAQAFAGVPKPDSVGHGSDPQSGPGIGHIQDEQITVPFRRDAHRDRAGHSGDAVLKGVLQ